MNTQANELDDRLGELTSCISEMWSGRKTEEEESGVRGGRKYIQYLQDRWAWPRSWLPDISVTYLRAYLVSSEQSSLHY